MAPSEPKPPALSRRTLSILVGHARPHARTIALACVLGIVGSLAALAQPLVAGELVTRLGSGLPIAETLVISLNTVLRHVTHVLAKTGTANRTEAARYAVRQGLVEPD